jgi:hypothetical protein
VLCNPIDSFETCYSCVYLNRCLYRSPIHATKSFSVFADNEASQLDRY